ncbi:hypothetical protein, partial [Corallococcus aberystwythensis]|uniref:hypothetical protein n=1 Tax=Corallococcus aberystwythensis TaxID=2316722 RepID=UPI001ABFFD8B
AGAALAAPLPAREGARWAFSRAMSSMLRTLVASSPGGGAAGRAPVLARAGAGRARGSGAARAAGGRERGGGPTPVLSSSPESPSSPAPPRKDWSMM